MTKVKLYDENRYFIGETTVEVASDCVVLVWGPEFFLRSKEHADCFQLAIGLTLKNGEVKL